MKISKVVVLIGGVLLGQYASAADLNVYWSTDGLQSKTVQQYAERLSQAVEAELGVSAEVIIADARETSQAVQQNRVDLLITCNEVDTSHAAAVGQLSRKQVGQLKCVGGSLQGDWSLAMDQDVKRESSAELWVYVLRNSSHFTKTAKLREVMPSIQKKVNLKALEVATR